MKLATALRWWPPIGIVAMLMLGWSVGKGPTPVDERYTRVARAAVGPYPSWMLIFTEWSVLGPALAICVVVALYRRHWRLAALSVLTPFAAIETTEASKRLFDRHIGGALAYPSGHMTLVLAVVGIVVITSGFRRWALVVAVCVSGLTMFGLACTYHYLTDTIGAVLLTTAILCIAARLATRAPAESGVPAVDRV
ncbi:MAG: PA-phosphatase [Mycobacteriaceae bacterium]|nr:PA-phosphatase [Mycobacteriaceae bacterium]